MADILKIEKTLDKIPPGTVLRLGGMTDCFQPLESFVRNTYRLIEALNRRRIGYLIVTKSDLVASDEYIALMDPALAHIQISVTCTDDSLYHRLNYEKACPPSKRIAAILKLQKKGFDVAVRLSPLIEEFIDFDAVNAYGIQKAIVEFLRVNTWIRKWFDIDYSRHTLRAGGYSHLPLEEKQRILARLAIPSISVCEDHPAHYDFFTSRYNPNPSDCCNLRL